MILSCSIVVSDATARFKSGGCKKFCVNGHLVGNCRHFAPHRDRQLCARTLYTRQVTFPVFQHRDFAVQPGIAYKGISYFRVSEPRIAQINKIQTEPHFQPQNALSQKISAR